MWTNGSSRDSKKNFSPADAKQILDRLVTLPILKWNYKAEDEAVVHLGPTAEEFAAAFSLGASDKAIGTVDANGVALAAIQGIHELVQEKDAQIAAHHAEIDSLKERLAALETLVEERVQNHQGGPS